MSRFFRYAINKIYTICNILQGMKIARGAMLHFSSEIRNRKNIAVGKNSILYKKLSIYPGRNGSFRLGANSHIAPYGYFLVDNQSLTIGNDVAIGPFCSFFCSSNTWSSEQLLFRKNYDRGDIIIGNNVFIGAQSVIMPGTTIGNDVVVAANSVVKGTLANGHVYGGSPCKIIKKLNADD